MIELRYIALNCILSDDTFVLCKIISDFNVHIVTQVY